MDHKKKISTRSELKRVIREMIGRGMTREEVYRELKGSYRSDHALAVMVGENPELVLQKKYRPVAILTGAALLVVAGVSFFLFLAQKSFSGEYASALTFPIILAALAVITFWFIPIGFRLSLFAGYFALPYNFYLMTQSTPVENPDGAILLLTVAGIISSIAVIFLTGLLKRKTIPGYGLMGPGQDQEGNYKFNR